MQINPREAFALHSHKSATKENIFSRPEWRKEREPSDVLIGTLNYSRGGLDRKFNIYIIYIKTKNQYTIYISGQ